MVSAVHSGISYESVERFLLRLGETASVATHYSKIWTHIGIDLAQLLLKRNAQTGKRRPVKVAKPAAKSTLLGKLTATESH
jgi:hypothetical protein